MLKFNPKQTATIGNYAVSNGTSVALWRFKTEFPELLIHKIFANSRNFYSKN